MSALTLVMKELLDMNAEEFVNVRAYHSTGRSFKQVQSAEASSSPCSKNSSGIGSLTSSNSDEEPTTSSSSPTSLSPTPTAPEKTGQTKVDTKESKSAKENLTKKGKERLTKKESMDIKIMYGGRNILNLERNLVLYQWQLSSPIANNYSNFGYSNQLSSFRFIQDSGALEEIMTTCSECNFREPIQF